MPGRWPCVLILLSTASDLVNPSVGQCCIIIPLVKENLPVKESMIGTISFLKAVEKLITTVS
jgi:hypothetical protein